MLPLAQPSFLKGDIKTRPGGTTWDRQENDLHCLGGYPPADTTMLFKTAWVYMCSACSPCIVWLLVLLWKGGWSQIKFSGFPSFSPFFSLTGRHFWLSSSLLNLYLYRRYSSPISCSRQTPLFQNIFHLHRGRGANSTCIHKHNLAFLSQSLFWQLKAFLQSCHMSLLEELQPWAELKLCKAHRFLPYILQMGSLSSGR